MKKKIFINFIISFLIICQFSLYPKQAKALAGSFTLTSGVVVGSVAESGGATAAVSVLGPYAIPIVIGAIGLGVVFKYRHEISDFAIGFYDYLKQRGETDTIIDKGDYSELTTSGKQYLRDYVNNYNTGVNTPRIPLVENIKVPANTIIWTSIQVPIIDGLEVQLDLHQTGTKIIDNVNYRYKIDDYTKIYKGTSGLIMYIDGVLRIGGTVPSSLPTQNTVYVGLENIGNFDTDVGISQIISKLPKSRFTGVTGDYLVPEFSSDTSTFIRPSTDFNYDNYVDKTYTQIGDYVTISDTPKTDTGTGDDVGTNPDDDNKTDTDSPTWIDTLWDWLSDILDSVKSIPKTIDKVFETDDTSTLDFTPLMIATRKFPFCIPWDMYECVKVFEASEEPLKYEFKEVKYANTDIIIIPNFVIDFSKISHINILRGVFRFIMYISFVTFLINKIRELMRS